MTNDVTGFQGRQCCARTRVLKSWTFDRLIDVRANENVSDACKCADNLLEFCRLISASLSYEQRLATKQTTELERRNDTRTAIGLCEVQAANRIARDKSPPGNTTHWAAGTYTPFAELMLTPDISVSISTGAVLLDGPLPGILELLLAGCRNDTCGLQDSSSPC